MIAVIDYDAGNLRSVQKALDAIGEENIVTKDRDEILKSDRVILPGVGAFGDAIGHLETLKLDKVIKEVCEINKPLLGICLGMQLLLDLSFEFGEYQGLGLIPGNVRPIADVIDPELKIPHIGWNPLLIRKESPIFRYIREGDCVYFVHSYYAADCQESVIAEAEYSVPLTAAVAKENVFGCQFHPEKSGEVGLKILQAFCEL